MKQLELQFDGYADERKPIDVNLDATKQRVKELVGEAEAVAILFIQAAAAVTFGFGIMFLSAIIGG